MSLSLTPRELHNLAQIHGEPVTVSDARRADLLFPDGAQLVSDRMYPPPDDRVELLRVKREFCIRKLQLEEHDFNSFRNEVSRQASFAEKYANMMPPPQSALDDLKRGRDRILALRESISTIDEQLAQSEEAKLQREDEAAERRRQQQMQGYLSELRSIEI